MASIPDPPALGADAEREEGGDYEVGALIREGWGGTIREGRYRRSGRRVTVQDVRPDITAGPGVVDRLGAIGREAASLRDPHLLAVYDLVDADGAYRLVAEWSDGSTLAARLSRGPLPPAIAIGTVSDTLVGLAVLHSYGLFHGQVGPETVVLDSDGTARLAELALCAAAAPAGFGAHTDVRDTARLGLHLLRNAGSLFDPVRRPLEAAAADGGVEAARLQQEVEAATGAVLGPTWRARGAGAARAPRGRGRRRSVVLLLVALLVVAAGVAAAIVLLAGNGSGTAPGTPLAVGADATLEVTPAAGGCNTTFTFVARGSLSGTGTLVYRWDQSDGQVTSDTPLPITSNEGAFQLSQAWRLQGSQTVNGTMTLHVLKPVDRKLSRSFRYTCP